MKEWTATRGTSCMITAFRTEAVVDALGSAHPWYAIATANVFDGSASADRLTREDSLLAGVPLRAVTARASAETEPQAIAAALQGLLFQLEAQGFLRKP